MAAWLSPGWGILIVIVGLVAVGVALLDRNRTRIPWLVDWSRWAVAALGLAACILVALIIFFIVLMLPFTGAPGVLLLWRLEPYIAPQNATEKAALVQAQIQAAAVLVQVFGGGFLIATLFYTLRTIRITQEGNRLTQEGNQLTREQIQISQEGQITERFTRATDQIGSEKLAIRLGGIYSLERIAHDSSDNAGPILEILAAYVREHAPPPNQGQVLADQGGFEHRPPADIQAILTVIGRRDPSTKFPGGFMLSFEGADLRGVRLSRAYLEETNFRGTHLEGAQLSSCNVMDSSLPGAHLEGAGLGFSHLEGSVIQDAHLEGAWLNYTHLENAGLERAHLEGAKMWAYLNTPRHEIGDA